MQNDGAECAPKKGEERKISSEARTQSPGEMVLSTKLWKNVRQHRASEEEVTRKWKVVLERANNVQLGELEVRPLREGSMGIHVSHDRVEMCKSQQNKVCIPDSTENKDKGSEHLEPRMT